MTLAPELRPELESDVALRDGSVAHIRPIRGDDEPYLLALLRGLSDEDRRMRFFSLGNDVSRTAHDEATVDNVHSLGLLATVGSPERVVGHALYARVETHDDWDSIDVTFPSSLTPNALVRFEQREELASANALRRVLYPRSVAVIGASERPGAVGAAVVRNLLAAGFPGPIYPINPAGGVIQAL